MENNELGNISISVEEAEKHAIKINPNPPSLIEEYELQYKVISIEYNPEIFTDEVVVKINHTDNISSINHVEFDEKIGLPNPLSILQGHITNQCVDGCSSTIDISVESIMNGSIQFFRNHKRINAITYCLPQWLTDKSLLNEPFAIQMHNWINPTVYLYAGYDGEQLIFISSLSSHPYWQKLFIRPYDLNKYSIRWIGDRVKHDTQDYRNDINKTSRMLFGDTMNYIKDQFENRLEEDN